MSLLGNEFLPDRPITYELHVTDDVTGDEIAHITAPTQDLLVEKFGAVDEQLIRYESELQNIQLDYEEDLT